jgi:hypothetical protein
VDPRKITGLAFLGGHGHDKRALKEIEKRAKCHDRRELDMNDTAHKLSVGGIHGRKPSCQRSDPFFGSVSG